MKKNIMLLLALFLCAFLLTVLPQTTCHAMQPEPVLTPFVSIAPTDPKDPDVLPDGLNEFPEGEDHQTAI